MTLYYLPLVSQSYQDNTLNDRYQAEMPVPPGGDVTGYIELADADFPPPPPMVTDAFIPVSNCIRTGKSTYMYLAFIAASLSFPLVHVHVHCISLAFMWVSLSFVHTDTCKSCIHTGKFYIHIPVSLAFMPVSSTFIPVSLAFMPVSATFIPVSLASITVSFAFIPVSFAFIADSYFVYADKSLAFIPVKTLCCFAFISAKLLRSYR